MENALIAADELGANAIQIFSHNARSWRMTNIKPEQLELWHNTWKDSGVEYVVIHTSYLINLASPKEDVYEKSVKTLLEEVVRAGQLGIPHINTHVGKHLETGIDAGIEKIVVAIDEVLATPEAREYPDVMILLENDAGTGSTIGVKFAAMGQIIDNVKEPDRLGICFDTCHGFAAGYDFSTSAKLDAMLEEVDQTVGIDKLKLIHANDSKHELDSRKDRHEHIGQGHIGEKAFELILNHPKTRDLPFVLETPKAPDEEDKLNSDMDPVNIATMRRLRKD
jgi:deoxyribonuclease-4